MAANMMMLIVRPRAIQAARGSEESDEETAKVELTALEDGRETKEPVEESEELRRQPPDQEAERDREPLRLRLAQPTPPPVQL